MKKGWIIAGTAGLGAAVIAPVIWFQFATSLFYQGSAYSFPQQVLLARPSPNGKYVAKIVSDEETKSIVFAVEGVDGTRFLLDRQFVPSVAQHEPIVSISWATPEIATIVVNDDFGEGNLVFEFNAKDLSFKQTGTIGDRPRFRTGTTGTIGDEQ